ncbi:NAD(P)/FAD-dependent oxidoreductase [Streptomyces glaucosporus]|uniref:NAD(P)/FAD-dependent oxidoreductase n=1 Tax=Streptomyces glaucosporus TaxID=284044 RepID=A0ABN3IGC1_9ACTN
MIDLLVAGGGPAGLAAAVCGALAGMETVVVEPREAPVDKACGEGVMPGGVRDLRELGVDLGAAGGRELRGIRYTDGVRSVQAAFRGGPGLGVRRTGLHRALWSRAVDLGVRIVPGRVGEVRQTDGAVLAAGWRARWMIAADGLHSPVRRALGLQAPWRGARRYGLRRHYRVAPWTDFVEVHWSAHGEAYVTPVGEELVGIAVLSAERRRFDAHLACFPRLAPVLSAPAAGPVRGAGPLRQRVRGRVAGRVLLAGDAAGYVDALTGEGIALAVASARAAVDCLAAGRPAAYEAAWRRLSRRHRLLTGALVRASGSGRAARLVVPVASRFPVVFGAAVRALR